jgi:hypothetical protein
MALVGAAARSAAPPPALKGITKPKPHTQASISFTHAIATAACCDSACAVLLLSAASGRKARLELYTPEPSVVASQVTEAERKVGGHGMAAGLFSGTGMAAWARRRSPVFYTGYYCDSARAAALTSKALGTNGLLQSYCSKATTWTHATYLT